MTYRVELLAGYAVLAAGLVVIGFGAGVAYCERKVLRILDEMDRRSAAEESEN